MQNWKKWVRKSLGLKLKYSDNIIKKIKVNKMSVKEYVKTNRTKILAMVGNVLAMIFEEVGDYIAIIMPGTPFGEFIKRLSSIVLFGAYAITMYVFGNKHELDLKSNTIMQKDMEIHALRTNEAMKDYLLAENNITAPKFDKIE